MSRIKFNTQAPEWKECMDKCSKYNRASAPSFTNQEELGALIRWNYNTTTDPSTNTLYPDTLGKAIWLPFR